MRGSFWHAVDLSMVRRFLMVSANTFGGVRSILVITINNGIPKDNANPRCSLVMPITPAFPAIRSITKSGKLPVIPNTVVWLTIVDVVEKRLWAMEGPDFYFFILSFFFTLRYFSWPARSTKLTILEALLQISSHPFRPGFPGCGTIHDFESKPMISPPTLEVRPDSLSCRCLREREREIKLLWWRTYFLPE